MSKNRLSDRRLVEFLENLALMLAAAWSLGFLVLIGYAVLTNDPKDNLPQPPPQKVILPDGREGIVTEVIVNPDGTRSFKVKEKP